MKIKDITCAAWSSNGAYLLTSGSDCQLLLWDVHTRETLDRYKSDSPMCGVVWLGNDAAVMTHDGELAVWRDVVPEHMPSATKPDTKAAVFDNDAAKIAQLMSASASKKHHRADDSDANDNDDDDDPETRKQREREAIKEADLADAEVFFKKIINIMR